AVVGAATSGDRSRGALKGAVAGGAIGAGVGQYMDRQEAALRQRLQGTGVQVRREGDRIELIMPGNTTFETDRSDIRADFHAVPDSEAMVSKEFDQTAVKVSGPTDSTASASYNPRHSTRRADSGRRYLLNRDVAEARVQA